MKKSITNSRSIRVLVSTVTSLSGRIHRDIIGKLRSLINRKLQPQYFRIRIFDSILFLEYAI